MTYTASTWSWFLSRAYDPTVPVEDTDFYREMQRNRVGNLLEAARLRACLKQKELAEKVSVKQSMISDYERGKRRSRRAPHPPSPAPPLRRPWRKVDNVTHPNEQPNRLSVIRRHPNDIEQRASTLPEGGDLSPIGARRLREQARGLADAARDYSRNEQRFERFRRADFDYSLYDWGDGRDADLVADSVRTLCADVRRTFGGLVELIWVRFYCGKVYVIHYLALSYADKKLRCLRCQSSTETPDRGLLVLNHNCSPMRPYFHSTPHAVVDAVSPSGVGGWLSMAHRCTWH